MQGQQRGDGENERAGGDAQRRAARAPTIRCHSHSTTTETIHQKAAKTIPPIQATASAASAHDDRRGDARPQVGPDARNPPPRLRPGLRVVGFRAHPLALTRRT